MPEHHIKNLPGWSEDEFASLCSTAGVTRNKSTHDASGWDYLIQFPNKPVSGLPYDLAPGEISARVQVKSKEKSPATTRVKLSNALRFAKDDAPCFIVLFVATDQHTPVKTYCKHFWKEEIATALKRAREASRDGRHDLNRITINYSFGPADEHTHDLIEWIEKTIRQCGDGYAQTKALLHQNVGFESGRLQGTISLEPQNFEEIVNHQIGLTPTIAASHIVMKEQRFGIEGITLFKGKPHHLSIHSIPRQCRLRLYTLEGDEIWFDADLFLPGLPGLPVKFLKLRIKADFLEIVISVEEVQSFKCHVTRTDLRTLPQWRAFIDVMNMLSAGEVLYDITHEDKLLLSGSMSAQEQAASLHRSHFTHALECLETITRGRLPADFTFSSEQVADVWDEIVEFNELVTGTNMAINFTLQWNSSSRPDLADASIYFYGWLQLGEWSLLTVVRRTTIETDWDDTNCRLKFGVPKVVHAIIRKGPVDAHKEEILAAYSRLSKMESKNVILELHEGNYHDVAASVLAS